MDAHFIGIDVSKDRLDVAATTPSINPFHVSRDHAGLADLAERLKALSPERVALEATGGFETVAAAALTAAGLPVVQGLWQRRAPAPVAGCGDRGAR